VGTPAITDGRRAGNAMGRSGVVLGLAGALLFGGMATASAWTYATTSSPLSATYNGVSFADGAGSMTRSGFSNIVTTARTKDPVANSGAAYIENRANKPGQLGASSQTVRRTASSWAVVAIDDLYSSSGWAGAWGFVNTCEDVSFRPDICSPTRSSRL